MATTQADIINAKRVVESNIAELQAKLDAYRIIGRYVIPNTTGEGITEKQIFADVVARIQHEIVALEYLLKNLRIGR